MKKIITLSLLGLQAHIIYGPDIEERTTRRTDTIEIKRPSVSELTRRFEQPTARTNKPSSPEELETREDSRDIAPTTDQGLSLEIATHKNTTDTLRNSIQNDLDDVEDLQKDYQRMQELTNMPENMWSFDASKQHIMTGIHTLPLDAEEELRKFATAQNIRRFKQGDNKYHPDRDTKSRKNSTRSFEERNNTAKEYTSDKTFSNDKLDEIQTSLASVKENLNTIHTGFEKLENKKLKQKDIDALQEALNQQQSDIASIQDRQLRRKLRSIHNESQELVTKMQDAFIKQTIADGSFKKIKSLYNSLPSESAQAKLSEQVNTSGNTSLIEKFNNLDNW